MVTMVLSHSEQLNICKVMGFLWMFYIMNSCFHISVSFLNKHSADEVYHSYSKLAMIEFNIPSVKYC